MTQRVLRFCTWSLFLTIALQFCHPAMEEHYNQTVRQRWKHLRAPSGVPPRRISDRQFAWD